MGRLDADLVIQNGTWLCVQSGEFIPETEIAVKGQRIAYVGPDAGHTIGPGTHVIQAQGRYLVPGLLDGHTHIEMAMMTLTEFVRAAVACGTTGIFIDPHEIANVLGLEGVRWIVEEAERQPIHVWVQMPSCVPAGPGLETSGASIGPPEVALAMEWPGIIGLGEVMSFPGVITGDPDLHAEIAIARSAGRVVGGHYASPDLGLPFHAYAAAGPQDDHEGKRVEDAVARVRQGLKTMLRLGSGIDDLTAQIRAITELGLDARHFILVSDGLAPTILVEEGHMDRAVRHAIKHGLAPMTAIQMATLNPAEHFGVSKDIGQIAPGRYADILLVDDLTEMSIDAVIARGALAVEGGDLLAEPRKAHYPEAFKRSVQLAGPLAVEAFVIRGTDHPTETVNVIGMLPGQIDTRHLKIQIMAVGGELRADLERDLAKVAVIDRYRPEQSLQIGFVHGFGFREPCAVGSTVAHDSHHIVIVGTDEASMAHCANELALAQGGQMVANRGRTLAQIALPIAGLMSDQPAARVAEQAQLLEAALIDGCGCQFPSALTQISRLALVVIPELRISNLGVVDVTNSRIIPLIVQQDGDTHR